MNALSRALEQQGGALTVRVVDQLFHNPFWLGRFPRRGRTFAEEDGLHHLSYVRQALEGDDVEIFLRYARWLQPVLTSRGMCSRHLAENFEKLSELLGGSDIPDVEPARKVLIAGAAALVYREGAAVPVERVASAAGRLALETLDASLPGWQQGWCDAPAPTSGEQARYWTSYVVDAVALGSTASLSSYFEWLARHLAERGKPERLAHDIRAALRYGFSSKQEDGAAAVEVLDSLDGRPQERTS